LDIISETMDGVRLAPTDLVASIIEKLTADEIEVSENATYRLHPASTGHSHSARFPQQVVCLEIRRDLLADPFVPFAAMHISQVKVTRMANPIAAALGDHLQNRG
jgi:predicted N-formylglutamate amidohydrolase